MKILFRLALVIVLGAIAAILDTKLWGVLHTGHPYTSPIMGLMTRRGVISADPVASLFEMTVLCNAAFLVAAVAWFFPGPIRWLRQKKLEIWSPTKEPDPPPPWICAHYRAENPENFGECWKCQRIRQGEN
jgi:hypothetical protein